MRWYAWLVLSFSHRSIESGYCMLEPVFGFVFFFLVASVPQSIRWSRYTLISLRWNWKLCVFRFLFSFLVVDLHPSAHSLRIYLLKRKQRSFRSNRFKWAKTEKRDVQMSYRLWRWCIIGSVPSSITQSDLESEVETIFSNWLNWTRSMFRNDHRTLSDDWSWIRFFFSLTFPQFDRQSVRFNWIQFNLMLESLWCVLSFSSYVVFCGPFQLIKIGSDGRWRAN